MGAVSTLARFFCGVLLAALCCSCDVDPLCLVSHDGSPTPPDAAPDSCLPGRPELCNGRDDDCDGDIDEGFDLDSDPLNCNACGHQCELPQAWPDCVEGRCVIDTCLPGAHDIDGLADNGCEVICAVVETATSEHCDGPDCCDSADNDCDGEEGEDHDLDSDPNHCGACASSCDAFPCPHVCAAPFADSECRDGSCVITDCHPGHHDLDGDPLNGCELACVESGEELCNGLDDNCDGEIDEAFPEQGDPCGPCDAGSLECVDGVARCSTPPEAPELCDGVDNDCDPATEDGADDDEVGQPCGALQADGCPGGTTVCLDGAVSCDEDRDPRGAPCGSSQGACDPGLWQCVDEAFLCEGGVAPEPEVCGDGEDNDCDGLTDDLDDDLALGALCDEETGLGGIGACAFGTLACVEGELQCEGFVPPDEESCNGLDDDCDGRVDEALALGRLCGPHEQTQGWTGCASGQDLCIGFTPLRPELCDAFDNDGDGRYDEDALCPAGECDSDNGLCTLACRDDEPLPCPPGMLCALGRCVGHLCDDVECGECERCDPSTGRCIDQCAGLSCDPGLICHCGRCWPPSCGVLGCPDGQVCRDDRCVEDPCVSADCGPDQGCADGVCFDVCQTEQCDIEDTCSRGECRDDPCHSVFCQAGECDRDTGECSTACVGVECPPGLSCDLASGQCETDPCVGVHCPESAPCDRGSCHEPPPPPPDDAGPDAGPVEAGAQVCLYASGGGGCLCRAGSSGSATPVSAALLLLGMLWVALRRR